MCGRLQLSFSIRPPHSIEVENTMKHTIGVAALLLVVHAAVRPAASPTPGLVGTWELVSRIDRDASGRVISETSLGAAPIGYLIYDAAGHMSAQLAARERTGLVCDSTGRSPDPNNNANISGYSAYFGRYQVDTVAHTVTHILEGTLSPADAGKRLWRRFRVVGDTLTGSMNCGLMTKPRVSSG